MPKLFMLQRLNTGYRTTIKLFFVPDLSIKQMDKICSQRCAVHCEDDIYLGISLSVDTGSVVVDYMASEGAKRFK